MRTEQWTNILMYKHCTPYLFSIISLVYNFRIYFVRSFIRLFVCSFSILFYCLISSGLSIFFAQIAKKCSCSTMTYSLHTRVICIRASTPAQHCQDPREQIWWNTHRKSTIEKEREKNMEIELVFVKQSIDSHSFNMSLPFLLDPKMKLIHSTAGIRTSNTSKVWIK